MIGHLCLCMGSYAILAQISSLPKTMPKVIAGTFLDSSKRDMVLSQSVASDIFTEVFHETEAHITHYYVVFT